MKRDNRAITLDRRQLLKSAVMGMATLPFASRALAVQAAADGVEVTGGLLAAVGDGWLEIEAGNHLRRFSFGGDVSFWKGGESTPAALTKGDDLMIKMLAVSGHPLRIWSNLSRIGGKVLRVTKDGYILQVGDLHTPRGEMMLVLTDHTLFGNTLTDNPTRTQSLLTAGDAVDAIGERISGGLRATLVYVYRQDSVVTPPHKDKPTVTVTPDCISIKYTGYATWFDCSTGAGRCGTCNTTNSSQAAWPAFDTCGCCSSTCCDCSKNCDNQARLSCGSSVTVADACSTKQRGVSLVDCGPCQEANCSGCSPQLCGRRCGDCAGYSTPIVDLTRPTFAMFYDPATRGCFSCTATACV